MLTAVLTYALLIVLLFPETAAARWVRGIVETIRDAFGKISRRHLIFLALMAVMLVAGSELLAIAGPFDTALVVLWDLSTYIDIVLTTAVVASAARGGAGWRAIVARFFPRRTPRARRRRAPRPLRPSANDDDRPAFAAHAA